MKSIAVIGQDLMIRNCPICSEVITYSFRRSYRVACKRSTHCESCRSKSRRSKAGACTDETRRKMSLSHQGVRNHFFGQRHTEEARRKIGKATSERDQSGRRNPFYGRKHSDETRARMSHSRADGLAAGRIAHVNQYGRKSWHSSSKRCAQERCDSVLEILKNFA